jgi:hypothetical protein
MAADGGDEDLGDRLVIALGGVVHPAHALIVAADQIGQVALERDLRPLQDQPGAGGKMGLVGPFGLGQAAREEAAAGVADRRVVRPEPRCMFGHVDVLKRKGSAPASAGTLPVREQ